MSRRPDSIQVRRPGASCLILIAHRSTPQTADTAILETITDSSGPVIPGTSIEIRQLATGFTRIVAANASGYYELRYLVLGEYTVGVTRDGFAAQLLAPNSALARAAFEPSVPHPTRTRLYNLL